MRSNRRPNFENIFNEKAFGKKSRPKITSSPRKSLNANEKAYYCRVVKNKKMVRSNECAPTGVPILKYFSMQNPSEKVSPQNYIKSAKKP